MQAGSFSEHIYACGSENGNGFAYRQARQSEFLRDDNFQFVNRVEQLFLVFAVFVKNEQGVVFQRQATISGELIQV
ncbi:hypothetical protein [Brevibacillus sp. 179-C 1.1 NHS]|uniref:hypothetical protein n=1 Tax=Brevibacillus sp. 179-C 1.1 NHS TaxID=3235177 RepID=UPI0039A2D882